MTEDTGVAVACFWPRHALRTTDADGHTHEVLICFECENGSWYRDGEMVGGWQQMRTEAARPAFDRAFAAAGVSVPPSPCDEEATP